MSPKELTHIALFAGIGGDSLAAKRAGFRQIAFCENDKFCQRVLRHHWQGVPIIEDIHDFTIDVLVARGVRTDGVTLVSGGFPCQPYSGIGLRKGKEDPRALWPQMRRVITEVSPAWVVAENVPGLIRMGLDEILSELEEIGYIPQTFYYPASSVGAPHLRERIFIVAYADRLSGTKADTTPFSLTDSRNSRMGLARQNGGTPTGIERESPQSDMVGGTNGVPRELDTGPVMAWANDWQYRVSPAGDDAPDWQERIKALGNAILPKQILPIMQAIADYERNN